VITRSGIVIADRSPFLSREDDAGGIAGVGEEQRSRARRDRSLEVGGVQPEAVLRAQRHRHQMRARGFERPRIGGVERVEGQHLVAFAADAHRCGEQGVLGARGDDDLVLAHRLSRAPLVQLRDGASQGLASPGGGVVGVLGAQRGDRAVYHRGRGRQSRVADA
jgi:hypothetical protein